MFARGWNAIGTAIGKASWPRDILLLIVRSRPTSSCGVHTGLQLNQCVVLQESLTVSALGLGLNALQCRLRQAQILVPRHKMRFLCLLFCDGTAQFLRCDHQHKGERSFAGWRQKQL